MKPEELERAFKLLFEQFWVIRSEQPEDYFFIKKHQQQIAKELRERFGMNLFIKPQFIQLLKRPHRLFPWMGEIGFSEQLDYVLLMCGLAYIEEREVESAFMLEELVRDLELLIPEEITLDWTNYSHRKSLVRVLKKMLELKLIEVLEGETTLFEQSEGNQEVLYMTTTQARYFLSRAPSSYSEYPDFETFWTDIQENRGLNKNQEIYQRLMLEPLIERGDENEDLFIRMRNYYRSMSDWFENQTAFSFELYRDYGALTLEQRDGWPALFPSRQVIDEILIQLATVLQNQRQRSSVYGEIDLTMTEWMNLLQELREEYLAYWSQEFVNLNQDQLSQRLLQRGEEWALLKVDRIEQKIIIQPVMARMTAVKGERNE